jgi:hypothetical protein
MYFLLRPHFGKGIFVHFSAFPKLMNVT